MPAALTTPITPAERIAFQDRFAGKWTHIAQQKVSRLIPYGYDDPIAKDARFAYFDFYGTRTPQKKIGVAPPTPNRKGTASRRRATLEAWDDGEVFDPDDIRAMAQKPQPAFLVASNAGFQRGMDQQIINACLGTAYDVTIDPNDPTAMGTATAVPLPSGQKIVHGAAGLTLAKMLAAKRLLDAAEVEEEGRWFALTSYQMDVDLLNITEVKSSDYNTIKALVNGEVDTYLGFKFIRLELLPSFSDTGTQRQCIAGGKNAFGWYGDKSPAFMMGLLPGNSFAEQLYLKQLYGAVRGEEYRIVEVQCKEV